MEICKCCSEKCHICSGDLTKGELATMLAIKRSMSGEYGYKLKIKKGGFFSRKEIEACICKACKTALLNLKIASYSTSMFDTNCFFLKEKDLINNKEAVIKDSNSLDKDTIAEGRRESKKIDREEKRIKDTKKKIVNLLKKLKTKIPASDIDAHLKHKDVDEIKDLCEEMYHDGKISRTGNYRYFVLTK